MTKTSSDLKLYDEDKFCESLLNTTNKLNNILNTDDVNIQVNILTSVLTECLDNIAPIVTRDLCMSTELNNASINPHGSLT